MVMTVTVLVLVNVQRLLHEESVRGVGVVVGVVMGIMVSGGLVLLVWTSVHLKMNVDGATLRNKQGWGRYF